MYINCSYFKSLNFFRTPISKSFLSHFAKIAHQVVTNVTRFQFPSLPTLKHFITEAKNTCYVMKGFSLTFVMHLQKGNKFLERQTIRITCN